MRRHPDSWDRVGLDVSLGFEPRVGFSDLVMYAGLVRRRALGLGLGGLYWLKFRG